MGVPVLVRLFGGMNDHVDPVHRGKNLLELFLTGGIIDRGGEKASLVIEDLAIVALAEETVEIEQGLGLNVRIFSDHGGKFAEFGIGRPNFGSAPEILLHSRLVTADGGGFGGVQLHVTDSLGRLDGGERLGIVEIFRHAAKLGNEFFGENVVAHLHC